MVRFLQSTETVALNRMKKTNLSYTHFVPEEKYFNLQDVNKIVENELKNKNSNTMASIVLFYEDDPKRGLQGKFFNVRGDPIYWFDNSLTSGDVSSEDVDIVSFSINFVYQNTPKTKEGGCSKSSDGTINNCFLHCLLDLEDREIVKKPLLSKLKIMSIKKHLGLGIGEKISIDHIPKIEKFLGNVLAINVIGDFQYKSDAPTTRNITLSLRNQHYTRIKTNVKGVFPKWSDKVRPIALYKQNDTDITCYDGKLFNISKKDMNTYYKKPSKSTHTFIKNNDINNWGKNLTELIKQNDAIVRATMSKVDLTKLNGWRRAILYTYNSLRTVDFTMMSREEEVYISQSLIGAVIHNPRVSNKEGFDYDYSSFYPSIMKWKGFQIPTEEGDYKYITQEWFDNEFKEKNRLPYGIYAVKIIKSDNPYCHHIRNRQKYTHIELDLANKLGCKFIVDEKTPMLYYDRTILVRGSVPFGKYIDYFYNLKNSAKYNKPLRDASKQMLNRLWGIFSRKNNTFVKSVKFGQNAVEMDYDIIDVEMLKTKMKITFVRDKQLYEYGEARMTPFLLAWGRRKIIQTLMDTTDYDNIIKIHTDGFLLKKPIDSKFLGNDDMGNLLLKREDIPRINEENT